MTGNTAERWGNVQIGLHWTIAALILIQVPAAWGMVLSAPGAVQDLLYNVHKNVGVIVFVLACVRLAWRWGQPVPLLPADLPAWQARAARVTHFLLYLLLFLMPITGFLYTALSGFPIPLFMIWDLSHLVAVNKPAGEWFKIAHLSLQWLLYLTVLLHVAGALQHHLVRKDWVLRRMLSSQAPLRS
ncbi:MAG: cytochrome b [Geminicoccaceae bacterium]